MNFKMRHVGIVVRNMEISLKFYVDLLGCKVVKRMEECGQYIEFMLAVANVSVTTVKLETPDGQLIELLQFHRQMGPIKKHEIFEIGISHFAITVDDAMREYERLSEAGVFFNSGPIKTPDGKALVTFCADPDGTFIEVVEDLT